MTEQRAPQDPELRDLDCGWTTLPGAMPGMRHFRISQTHGDSSVTTILLTEKQAEKVAHTASQLAGAVPQEELRALIAKWRTKKWEDDHMAQMDVGVLFFPSHACADELESLIERRGNVGSTQHR